MSEIALRGVKKTYPGGFEAVKGIDIEIPDGELLVLVGPSGCGKSTLLRMIAGLESITSGEISIGDRVVNKLEPAERDIAMVFQNYALYPHMSVFDNMAYGLKNRGTPKAEIKQRVTATAEILELGHLLDRKPRQLSGGQRQRIAMGRAIVRKPTAFLFDEPLSNLDAKLRVQMRVEIKRLQRRFATTSVYVTHDQLEAMTLADRLVVMNGGQVEQIGRPMELYEKPATTFVAGFIGSPAMNLMPVTVSSGRAHGKDAPSLNLPCPHQVSRATLGIRPEDLAAAPRSRTDPNALTVPITVEAVEPVGHESFVHGTITGARTEITVRAGRELTAQPGDALQAIVQVGDLHWFDAETGKRI